MVCGKLEETREDQRNREKMVNRDTRTKTKGNENR